MRLYFQRKDFGLFLSDYIEVLRFILVNRSIFRMRVSDILRNITLYFEVIRDSREYILNRGWSIIQKDSDLGSE